ncbi:transforming growth factor-beta-induced protein ig-h3-like [Mytilus californianus]|uniref:transforming growth factor-beta-induced protein ig-h3-like n=1 Tax=Mytilus californianus TaxID=6549 RepID=UPI002245C7B1|nr:transforming growth factor-beta-induced protein ig-h3-like [Mytilus californianus]
MSDNVDLITDTDEFCRKLRLREFFGNTNHEDGSLVRNKKGTYTIYAPTNAAFDALGTEQELLFDKTVLTTILLYLLTNGVIRRSDAQIELTVESVAGLKVRFNIYYNKVITVEGSKISKFGLNASNGIVHVIDKVMIPPTGGIINLISGNKDLSTFLALFKRANITGIIQSDPLTVFSPTNAALDRLSPRILSQIHDDTTKLKELLEYYLVPHTEYSLGLYNREHLRTLDKKSETIRLSVSESTGVSINSYAHVIKPDITATNGVVHVIDHVLVPKRILYGFGK